MHDPHALAAATGRRLDQHRVADVAGRRDQVVVGQARAGAMPGTTGTPNADTVVLAAILSPMVWIALDRRPDEHDARRLQRGGEFGVLREESVAGMDRLRPGARGRRRRPRRC